MGAAAGGGFGSNAVSVRPPELNTTTALTDVFSGITGQAGQLAASLAAIRGADSSFGQSIGAQGEALTGLEELATSALQGFQDVGQSGLPSDLERNVLANVRSTQSSRGAIRNPGSALQEASRLGLASEQVRNQRLSQAQGALGAFFGASQNARQSDLNFLGTVLPGANNLLGVPMQSASNTLEARLASGQLRGQRFGQVLDFASSVGSAAAGAGA